MRNKTQERVEGLARERAAARRAEAVGEGGTAIDLGLVEEGIEIGKKIMAEVIAAAGKGAAAAAPSSHGHSQRTRLPTPKARTLRTPKTKLKWSRPSAAATSTRSAR